MACCVYAQKPAYAAENIRAAAWRCPRPLPSVAAGKRTASPCTRVLVMYPPVEFKVGSYLQPSRHGIGLIGALPDLPTICLCKTVPLTAHYFGRFQRRSLPAPQPHAHGTGPPALVAVGKRPDTHGCGAGAHNSASSACSARMAASCSASFSLRPRPEPSTVFSSLARTSTVNHKPSSKRVGS
jgi:hypothetical protein